MTLSDETLDIETPENVAFGYQVAGIGSRFLATLLDTILVGLLEVVVVLVTALFLRAFSGATWAEQLAAWIVAIFGLIATLFYWGYYVFFEIWDLDHIRFQQFFCLYLINRQLLASIHLYAY